MTFEEFNSTLTDTDPPAKLNDLLKSLWFDGRGDWEAAHDIAQEIHDKNGSWIHAYLHRKEGHKQCSVLVPKGREANAPGIAQRGMEYPGKSISGIKKERELRGSLSY
jgi:hypothetical protein